MSGFKDHFSSASERYAAYRPDYPAALFAWLAGQCAERALAWDCATGSGQAARGLAPHFRRVVATDASTEQIRHAGPHPLVDYRVAPAEASGLANCSADLVTVAQASALVRPTALSCRSRARAGAKTAVAAVHARRPALMAPSNNDFLRTFFRPMPA